MMFGDYRGPIELIEHEARPLGAFRAERIALLAALLNNNARLSVYYANNALLDGATLPDIQSLSCNLDGSAYNGNP